MKKEKYPITVCKPCWELKYCPYGPLVEDFPFPDSNSDINIEEVKNKHKEILIKIANGDYKDEDEIYWAINCLMYNSPSIWEDFVDYDCTDLQCNVFGHACPVFFCAEEIGETEKIRNFNDSRYISRETMLKVIRRDGQICQICFRYVPDNELEFDHIIPFSQGGPSSESNLRVACKECNRKKRDSLKDILSSKYKLGKENI